MSIEKEFVPYEEALALKELGFDEKCLAYYKENELYEEAGVCYKNADFEETMVWDEMLPNRNCAAPLYQQVFRWLRKKYEYNTEIVWMTAVNFKYSARIKSKLGTDYIDEHETYEEAELACLRKLIKIVQGGNK